MERTSFKSFRPYAVGDEIELMGGKWRVLTCDLTKAYLGFGFGVDQYHITAEEVINDETVN